MPTTTNLDASPQVLTAGASAEAVAHAVKVRAAVSLHTDRDTDEAMLNGVIVGEDGDHLLLEVFVEDCAVLAAHRSAPVTARLQIADWRYCFETQYFDTGPSQGTRRYRILRPEKVIAADRRRSRRRKFSEPSEILVHAIGGAESRACKADMLNLSSDGVAFRVQTEDVHLTRSNCALRVEFRVGRPPLDFNFAGRVVTKTQAGTPGHTVIGLEFTFDAGAEGERVRLLTALETMTQANHRDTER